MKSRTNDLEQQLAHLKWRRMQNERQIKEALVATKVLKQKDTIVALTGDQQVDKSLWMTAVVKDELTRPLVVTDEELAEVKAYDAKMRTRLSKYAQSQVATVHKLSDYVENTVCRSEVAKNIKQEQLQSLEDIKSKLQSSIVEIERFKPPLVNVKKGVTYPQTQY